MVAKSDLSATMIRLLHYMRAHGELRRFQGGFWATVDWQGRGHGEWFGTSTVNALQARGLIGWTGWQAQRNGPGFPIGARILVVDKECACGTTMDAYGCPNGH